jgi:hypothetical protein
MQGLGGLKVRGPAKHRGVFKDLGIIYILEKEEGSMYISKLKDTLEDAQDYSKNADASESSCVPLGNIHIQVVDALPVGIAWIRYFYPHQTMKWPKRDAKKPDAEQGQ